TVRLTNPFGVAVGVSRWALVVHGARRQPCWYLAARVLADVTGHVYREGPPLPKRGIVCSRPCTSSSSPGCSQTLRARAQREPTPRPRGTARLRPPQQAAG